MSVYERGSGVDEMGWEQANINPLLAAAFLDFPFCTSRPVARAKLIQIGQLFHSIVV